jgi:DNA-binding CsgD family transcriptional regulator
MTTPRMGSSSNITLSSRPMSEPSWTPERRGLAVPTRIQEKETDVSEDRYLEGQTALVTGATSGIGRAVAQELGQRGAEVFVHGRDAVRGGAVVDSILAAGAKAGLFPPEVTDESQLVRIALAAEDHELAASAVAAAQRRAELNPGVRTIAAAAAQARGLLSGDEEEPARAVELFEDGPRLLALASALEDLGAVRIKRGAVEDGIEALDRALALYGRAGAAWDAGRVRSRLRAQGVRRRLATTHERPETGWQAMTDSELAVARLVAQGATNREVAEQLFVSPHTVNSHLRQIFAKLDVNSRVALARLADDHDNTPESV